MQRLGRLGVAAHEDEVEPLQRLAVAQLARQRVALAQQHDVAFFEQRAALGAAQFGQIAEGQVDSALFERRADRLRFELQCFDAQDRKSVV